MKSIVCLKLISLIASLLCASYVGSANGSVKNIYLVRHAEKQSDGSKDPALTEAGKLRAQSLAKQLYDKTIAAIYSSNYQRTKQTAEPLAKQLNLEVTLYDPSELKEFAATIKSQQGNVLIVGHSNTTPALAYYLGGEAYGDIDESEYDRLYHLQVSEQQVKSELLRSNPIKQYAKLEPVRIDVNRFSTGENTYQMSFRGKPVGHAIHSFKQTNDSFELRERTLIESFNIDTDIQLSISKAKLQPISLLMTGSMGSPIDISLNWKDNSVTGHSLQSRATHKPQGKLEIERKLDRQTVERSSVLMLAHLFALKADQLNTFNWYNGYDDSVKTIEASYLGDKKVSVPAGTFDTQMIQFLGGAPSQIFYISKENQPKIVKIEVIASPWVYQLTQSK